MNEENAHLEMTNVMPDYLEEDLPLWLKEKNEFMKKSRKKNRKPTLFEMTGPLVLAKDTPSVKDYRAKYETFGETDSNDIIMNNNNNKDEDGKTIISTKSILAERVVDPGIKLAKNYLDDLIKKEKLARQQALLELEAQMNEDPDTPIIYQSEAALLEKEVDEKIALMRRNPELVKYLLNKKKKSNKSNNNMLEPTEPTEAKPSNRRQSLAELASNRLSMTSTGRTRRSSSSVKSNPELGAITKDTLKKSKNTGEGDVIVVKKKKKE